MALNHNDVELPELIINHFNTLADYQAAYQAGFISGTDITFIDENIQADWDETDSGSPAYIKNKPVISGGGTSVQSNWAQNDPSAADYIKNKPTIPASVTGTNDGTNWTTITIGDTTKNIPSGGGGGTANNGALTITTGATPSNFPVGFSANQSSNTTITLHKVVTTGKVGDLTNNANYITSAVTAMTNFATSADVVSALASISGGSDSDVLLCKITRGSRISGDTIVTYNCTVDKTHTEITGAAMSNKVIVGYSKITGEMDYYQKFYSCNLAGSTNQGTGTVFVSENVSVFYSYNDNKWYYVVDNYTTKFTYGEAEKLYGIESGAQVNIQADWSQTATTADDYIKNKPNYATSLDLSINNNTFVITGQLKDQNGNNLGTAQTIDLPLESVVVDGTYIASAKTVQLTLQSGSTVEFSIADLVNGLVNETTFNNHVASGSHVTTDQKNTWNGKQDAISDLAKIRSDAASGYSAYTGLTAHTGNGTIHVTSSDKTNWNSAYNTVTAHTGNTNIHVTTNEKSTWNEKQDKINDIGQIRTNAASGWSAYQTVTAHTGDSTVHITSTERTNWNSAYNTVTAHTGNTNIHVTTSDKSTWNGKQDAISDLAKIRSDAASGYSAYTGLTAHTGNDTLHLPEVTANDAGKILQVSNDGKWQLVSPVTIYSGTGAPAQNVGKDGDIYIQTT